MSDEFINEDISIVFIEMLDKFVKDDDKYYLNEEYLILKALILEGTKHLFKYCVRSHYKSVIYGKTESEK